MIDRGKGSKRSDKVKPVKNISKNPQSFLEISLVQKEGFPSHKMQDHVYEKHNPLELKKNHPLQENC